ncbi:helix-turn-helix domain-containing protein [Chryseosolibacter indicus]|uniref:Helix-turn-helix transcriptional regulator n=1 Tax=Chryseosolibacter indicus TaxID=2782351 RepID=A0ABS5VZ10_9BACT|nr:helix-turn-helix transcriptional regulator [Chryseosolibacter indicus]MBT1706100.1 helix-turn-helix transcriptional regulator [Chryseosolibacter indicus]
MGYTDIKSISELHDFFRYDKPVHPQITVVDLAKVDRSHREPGASYRLGLYGIACKRIEGSFGYGRTHYDFSEGTLMFTSPYQVLTPGAENKVEGWAIYIHPDFLNASVKGHKLTEYTFFGYDANEALHISEAEKNVLENCVMNIQTEIAMNLDKHSYDLIITNLELLLSYCSRFYGRQFLTRVTASNDIVARFDSLLNDYFSRDSLIEAGVPDVKYFASQLNVSANYLSDLLSKYTGKPTLEHIHLKLVDKAKALLWSTENSISEIAYDLGFEHPSHFTKLFKNRTGMSPKEFRSIA